MVEQIYHFWIPIRNSIEMYTAQSVAFSENFEWATPTKRITDGYYYTKSPDLVFRWGNSILHSVDKKRAQECTYLKGIQLLLTNVEKRNEELLRQHQITQYKAE